MGYEDRDYFQSKPKFEFASGVHNGTKGLMIAVIAAYVVALILSDSLEYAQPEFWSNLGAGNPKARLGYMLFVLEPANVLPVAGFEPGYWKLLTHWLVAPGIITLIVDVLMIYFVGRMLEKLLGTRRFLALFICACVASGLLASLADAWLVGEKHAVIMGPGGGVLACLLAPAWIAPRQKSLLGWPLRTVVLGFVAVFAAISLLYGVLGAPPAVQSPTQIIWGAAIGAAYMAWLKRRGRLPAVDGTQMQSGEAWERDSYLTTADGKPFDERKFLAAAEKQREEETREARRREEDKQRLDSLLAKISERGIDSLSRSEKKFLDEQSKKPK